MNGARGEGKVGEEFERRVVEDLRNITENLTRIDITLAKQQAVLDEHVRRTALAEERLELHAAELAPLKQHVAVWGYLGKILAAVATGAGLIATGMKLLGK